MSKMIQFGHLRKVEVNIVSVQDIVKPWNFLFLFFNFNLKKNKNGHMSDYHRATW